MMIIPICNIYNNKFEYNFMIIIIIINQRRNKMILKEIFIHLKQMKQTNKMIELIT
jgi:hypothetical protein